MKILYMKISKFLFFMGLICLLFISILSTSVFAIPLWSDNSTNVTSGSNYVSGRVYDFGINWTDSYSGTAFIKNATFETNYTGQLLNYTQDNITMVNDTNGIWNVSIIDLPVGTIQFKWYAINTSDDWDSTDQWTYTINKAATNTILYLNNSSSDRTADYYNYGELANLTVELNVSQRVELWTNFTGTYELWDNGTGSVVNYTTLSYTLGPYNVSGNFTENQNYTSSFDSHILTIWGYSEINESAHASSVTDGTSTHLYCRVRDKNTTSVISNYNVTFYDNSTGYIGSNLTNSSGWSNITKSWSSTGAYNITCNITDDASLYYNASESNTNYSVITVTATPSETTTTIPGGGGNGGGITGKKMHKKYKTWTKLTPGKAEIMMIDDPVIGLKQINITVRNPAQYVTITVTKLDEQPATVVHTVSGKVYKYIEIETKNLEDENLAEAKIQLQVNKSWISKNNIDQATIALNRYHDNKWNKLPTKKMSEDDDFIYYEAETPGFTTFAITGEEIVVTTTTTVPPATTTVATTTIVIPEIPMEVGRLSWLIFIVIIVIIVIAVIAWKLKIGQLLKKKKGKK